MFVCEGVERRELVCVRFGGLDIVFILANCWWGLSWSAKKMCWERGLKEIGWRAVTVNIHDRKSVCDICGVKQWLQKCHKVMYSSLSILSAFSFSLVPGNFYFFLGADQYPICQKYFLAKTRLKIAVVSSLLPKSQISDLSTILRKKSEKWNLIKIYSSKSSHNERNWGFFLW